MRKYTLPTICKTCERCGKQTCFTYRYQNGAYEKRLDALLHSLVCAHCGWSDDKREPEDDEFRCVSCRVIYKNNQRLEYASGKCAACYMWDRRRLSTGKK